MSKPHRIVPAALIGFALILFVVFALTGRLSPKLEPDSLGYIDFDWSAPLSQSRTMGYPLFLSLVGFFGTEQQAVPVAHFLMLVSACGFFYWGLLNIGFRTWTAGCCTIAMLPCRGTWTFGTEVLTESLAISFSIAATGCFLAACGGRLKSWSFTGCIVFTLAAYQVRPAFLFLVPLWPLASLLPEMSVTNTLSRRQKFQRAGRFAAGTILPLLIFCTMRLALVGHWGLVSFGGANIVGIAGQYLDEELVPQLSKNMQPLAKAILKKREQYQGYLPPKDFLTMEEMFNPTVWQMAIPSSQELHGDNFIETNQALTTLSREIIRLRPKAYLRWLVMNLNHGRTQILPLIAFDIGTVLAALLFIVAHAMSLFVPLELQQPDYRSLTIAHHERHVLLWLALLFAAGKVAIVILVEPANGRYMTPAMVLFPAVIMVFCAQYCGSVFQLKNHRRSGIATTFDC